VNGDPGAPGANGTSGTSGTTGAGEAGTSGTSGTSGITPVTYLTATFYDNSPTPTGVDDSGSACSAYPMGNAHTVYFAENMAGFPQIGDTVYTDEGITPLNTLGKYFGSYISSIGSTYYYLIDATTPGLIETATQCPAPPPSLTSISIYDSSPTPTGTDTSGEACATYPAGNSHGVYWLSNSPTSFPVNGDYLYLDSGGTIPLDTAGRNYANNTPIGGTRYITMDAVTPGLVSDSGTCTAPEPTFYVYSSDGPTLQPFADSMSACVGIANNYQFEVYVTKDPVNMDPNIIELNDSLFADAGKTIPLSAGWYGYNATAINYSLQLSPTAQVETKNNC
jgi:hypothetical protein